MLLQKYEIRLSIKAKNDIKSIINYIDYALARPIIAEKYAKLIKNEIQRLEYFPQKFAVIDNDIIENKDIRKLIIKNYIAFYRIDEEAKIVNVDRVLYGGSDWVNNI